MSFQRINTNDFIKSAKEYKSFDGYRCGLNGLDNVMRIDKKTLTTLVATPASGKSTFTNFYGFMMAKHNQWKTLYIATETPMDRQCRLLSMLFNSALTATQYSIMYDCNLTDWGELISMIKDAKEAANIDMVIVDNFTMLQHLIGEVNTTNIGKALTALKQVAIETDTAIILVSHTTKLIDGQDVTAYSVSGSANFFNVSDYMFTLSVTDRERYETTIKVLKVRDDAKGKMDGVCVLKYNPITKKYTDTTTPSTTDDLPFTTVCNVPSDLLENVKVSVIHNHKPKSTMALRGAINFGKQLKKQIDEIRAIDRNIDELKYKELKGKMPSFMPSCICDQSSTKNIKQINPLIAVDVDEKDNPTLNINQMRERVNQLPFILYCGLSVGGKGLYCIIPIREANKENFKGVFNAIKDDFLDIGLVVDSSCSNVNRERYMSYDDNDRWNERCEIYQKVKSVNPNPSHQPKLSLTKKVSDKDKQKIHEAVEDIKQNKLVLTNNHNDTLLLANCFANTLGEDGRNLLHLIRQQRSGYDSYKTDGNFDYAMEHLEDGEKFGLGLFFSKYNQAKANNKKIN